jgi:hypothetical protein
VPTLLRDWRIFAWFTCEGCSSAWKNGEGKASYSDRKERQGRICGLAWGGGVTPLGINYIALIVTLLSGFYL